MNQSASINLAVFYTNIFKHDADSGPRRAELSRHYASACFQLLLRHFTQTFNVHDRWAAA